MKDVILYIPGKGGSAAESGHYRPLFPNCEVFGLDYQTFTPWETGAEIRSAVESLKPEYENIILIANSIGAYFSMNAEIGGMISRAYFVSPIVDMERLITEMMVWANVTEEQLEAEGVIATEILYGSRDNLTSYETVASFAQEHSAGLTVMDGGEHWFHSDEQMQFLDAWIRSREEETR